MNVNVFDIQIAGWIAFMVALLCVLIPAFVRMFWRDLNNTVDHIHEDERIASVHQATIERESE